ncbi:MAG: hypothetical protein ACR2KM_03705 [Gemmatimonadaceae bacterium]
MTESPVAPSTGSTVTATRLDAEIAELPVEFLAELRLDFCAARGDVESAAKEAVASRSVDREKQRWVMAMQQGWSGTTAEDDWQWLESNGRGGSPVETIETTGRLQLFHEWTVCVHA